MKRWLLVALLAAPLSSCGPVVIQVPAQLTPGQPAEFHITYASSQPSVEYPSACLAVPDGWSVTGVSYSGPISGTGVADAEETALYETERPLEGLNWSCFVANQEVDANFGTRVDTVWTVVPGNDAGSVTLATAGGTQGNSESPTDFVVTVDVPAPVVARPNHAHDERLGLEGPVDVAWDGERLLVAGAQFLGSSDGGETFDVIDLTNVDQVVHGEGTWLAVTREGSVHLSSDGVTFDAGRVPPSEGNATSVTALYHDGSFVVGFQNAVHTVPPAGGTITTTTFDDWSVARLAAGADGLWMTLFQPDGFAISTSTDGWNWEEPTPTEEIPYDVTWAFEAWYGADPSTGQLLTSADGLSWTAFRAFETPWSVAGYEGGLLVGGSDGLHVSSTGEDWDWWGGVPFEDLTVDQGRYTATGSSSQVVFGYVVEGPTLDEGVVLPDAEVSSTYEAVIPVAFAGYGAGAMTLADGSTLPSGLELLADGSVTGIPLEDGAFAFEVVWTDASDRWAQTDVALVVADAAPTNGGGTEEPEGCSCSSGSSPTLGLLLLPLVGLMRRRMGACQGRANARSAARTTCLGSTCSRTQRAPTTYRRAPAHRRD